ncbi:plexin-C1 isoform X2 [Dunckerocampus dactyliophorus]|uniref:plexin-C1 isoform X2 n=1 Tax=Dunckerocampus dactyliophorus TaxID=161453 RepID=UPI002406E7BE|nr:plexin-C1 isoform X2 [Dunckerocampus dactyliophorus]
MLLLLSALISLLWPEASRCLVAGVNFTVEGDIRHLVSTPNAVYIAAAERLYQLNRDLSLVQTVNQRGVLRGKSDSAQFLRVAEKEKWNATFSVNVLLPFVVNGTLISCGVTDNECGYCELLALANISTVLYREHIQVGPSRRTSASVAFLVSVASRGFYILTAIEQSKDKTSQSMCPSFSETVYLHDTLHNQDKKASNQGGIFSFSGDGSNPLFKSNGEADFVDGFQIDSIIYLFANVPSSRARGNKVRLIWLQAKTKKIDTMKSLRGASLIVPGRKDSRLVASSVVLAQAHSPLWVGVFSVDGEPSNTELVLFDITPDLNIVADKDQDFCSAVTCSEKHPQPKVLQPQKVLFRQTSMTSVLAVKQGTWMVIFIGTGDGQLIKLHVDKNHHTACPTVLYWTDDDRKVFPRMHLDEVDHKHLYVAFGNTVQRVLVSKCHTHKTLRDCWSAQDPSCVWCGAKNRLDTSWHLFSLRNMVTMVAFSLVSCTFKDECQNSNWLSLVDEYQPKMISYSVEKLSGGQIKLNVQTNVAVEQNASSIFSCHFSGTSGELCSRDGLPPKFPECSCTLSNGTLPSKGMSIAVKVRLASMRFSQSLKIMTCSDIRGSPTAALCQRCIEVGCAWSKNVCSWATAGVMNDRVCQTIQSGMNLSKPEISSITPSIVSFYGHNNAVMSGYNLSHVIRVRIQTNMDCTPRESPVWFNTGMSLMFHIPANEGKGTGRLCAVLPDGSCHGNSTVTYMSSPSCIAVTPSSTWNSGKRKITLIGSNLEVVDAVLHSHTQQEVSLFTNRSSQNLTYHTPAAQSTQRVFTSILSLKVANESLRCSQSITYYPDPQFTSFTSRRTGEGVRFTIQKAADNLEMSIEDVSALGVYEGKDYHCIMKNKETSNQTDFFICEIQSAPDANFRQLKVIYGDKTVLLQNTSHLLTLMLLVLLLIPCIILVVVMVYRHQQRQLTVKMNKRMENLELDIRNDIRQGFVDLQTEKADLMENVGTIPFLDYKHFASRIFFPENEALMASCMADVGQVSVKVHLDECCHGLSRLIQDPHFLRSMVHAVEEQKSFTIKDKCALASLLTVALHSNLSYLTEVMEALLKDLMQKNNNTQPKMLLRRTECTVEKLLTNWMSICLYGFLRESVGQHLFLLVSALTQQIARGPVDCVTEKALYTLSEDWLLWQAQDFSSLRLRVLFAVGSDGGVSEPLEVIALSCDTVEQVKEKILTTFKAKFGFPYSSRQRSVCLELDTDGSFIALEEVDASSQVIGEVTMLNTLKHYKVPDGATIKVLSKPPSHSPQQSVKDDQDFSGKYFHLIDPDVDEDQTKSPERKKLKLKEVHLTKLLSTKVAVHSFVENLFQSIWGMPHCRAPQAVKYFFDFLDSQADNMKIPDPDVRHIWKTNSLPLRFWVNILKNPHFVFDMDKSPHLDGCLSVIAQAFMDSFSLSETQLGKHTPTNKLLYGKDIPEFKQEVKAYYRQIREQPPITHSDFHSFLHEESKHENEFNEAAALKELYKIIQRYFSEITEKLEQNGAPAELKEQLHQVKKTFDGLKSCSWS